MTLDLSRVYRFHVWKMAKIHNWFTEGDSLPFYRAWLRAEHLLRLDILLAEHREAFGTKWEPLFGRKGLNHLVFSRTGWGPDQVQQLSFADILLVLQKDLAAVKIPEKVLELPDSVRWTDEYELYGQTEYRIELPPCLEREWDHTQAEKAQGLRKPE
ncbi:hypothetical protein [Klebsiella quasipneumoniae]|uniref:ECs1072 family phage-associated protein n=1 Tax=Klebsiella quasipneumoniae TaxID=1463165 RepID=UPI0022868468|nr:hypothetical protein [Klebsiella quasipneumoniae]MCZ0714391.1 hypothetical protein [Klebsiella quasipneumoniae]